MSSAVSGREVPGIADDSGTSYQRYMGFWSLVALGVGSVIGSGWLFGAMYAAQKAGPISILGWIVGGVIMLSVALVTAELGMTRPESGGTSRYPLYSNGRLAAGVMGWCSVITVIGIPATEAAGVMQYASSYVPGLFEDGSLTALGLAASVGLLGVFTLLNFFGVKLFSESNNLITGIKVFIPITCVIALIVSGFTGWGGAGGMSNFTDGGGFAPYGVGAGLGIIATTGIFFAFNGAAIIVTLSGEAKNPQKTIPAAMITTILFSIALYVGLQFSFLVAVPADQVLGGWHGVSFDSPFAALALLVGMKWLYWILIADAMLSPSGAAIVGVASNARNVTALAKTRFLPVQLDHLHPKWRVPRRALTVNFLIGTAFLVLLPSWHAIVGIIGILLAFTLGIGCVSAGVFRRAGVSTAQTQIRGVQYLAPFAFSAGGLAVTWVPWDDVYPTLPFLAAGLVWYAIVAVVQKHPVDEMRAGIWLVGFILFLYVMCWAGEFGVAIIPTPFDFICVAAGSVGFYYWGVKEGAAYMSRHPKIGQALREGTGIGASE